jgi:hypothetical protein
MQNMDVHGYIGDTSDTDGFMVPVVDNDLYLIPAKSAKGAVDGSDDVQKKPFTSMNSCSAWLS